VPEAVNDWKMVDDDVMIKEVHQSVICISSDEENSIDEDQSQPSVPTEKMSADERQSAIRKEIMESISDRESEDEIELMDDDFENDTVMNISSELADTSLIDDLFGEDTLYIEFKKENALIASSSRYHNDPDRDIITCPVCQEKLQRSDFTNHIDGCTGIVVTIQPKSLNNFSKNNKSTNSSNNFIKKTIFAKSKPLKRKLPVKNKHKIPKAFASSTIAQHSSNINFFSDDEDENNEYNNDAAKSYNARISSISAVTDVSRNNPVNVEHDGESTTDDGSRTNRRRGLDMSMHACPVCAEMIYVDNINDHLDLCLG